MKIPRQATALCLGLAILTGLFLPLGSGGPAVMAADTDPGIEQRLTDLERAKRLGDGARIFRRACAACHGVAGTGDGPGAADLDPPPRDLTTRRFRFRTTPDGAAPRPEDLKRVIREGLPGSAMPGFGDLFSDNEMTGLVAFIYSLQPWLTPGDAPPEALAFSPVPLADPAAIEDGRALFLLVGCWRCHGLDGSGRGPSARGLTDEEERPIRSTDFRYDPFKGGHAPEAVVRALRTGLNGTPMPSYDEAMLISRSDTASAVALDGQIPSAAQALIESFIADSPTREALDSMTDEERAELRDRRVAALAHYVLSFDRRGRTGSKLFHRKPEIEARKR